MHFIQLYRICIYYLLLVGCISIISSCNSLKESTYSNNNIVETGYLQHYFNDTLKISISFFGGHVIKNPPLVFYKKYTPAIIKNYIRGSVINKKKAALLFYSHSGGHYFGFYYLGFIDNNKGNYNNYEKGVSVNGAVYYQSALQKTDSFLVKKYIIPLNGKQLSLYVFKKILYNINVDSSVLINDLSNELATLKTGKNYVPVNPKTKYFSDSLLQSTQAPGYLKPLNELTQYKSRPLMSSSDSSLLNQLFYTAFSSLDEIDSIRQYMFEAHTTKGNDIKNRSVGNIFQVHKQFAIPKILEAADKNKMLMINESHYDWRHKYLVTLLLDSLYKRGYKYLCMEALAKADSINIRKFPVPDDGYYIKEPYMGNLARTALKIGFKLIAYEDTTNNLSVEEYNSPIDKREYLQARNLYNQYKKDTTAKWLVYAGYAHINHLNFSSTEPSVMAKYFYEFSGIRPFSINQTFYCDIFSTAAVDDSAKADYYYLKNAQVNDTNLLGQSDLYIINNISVSPYEKNSGDKELISYKLNYSDSQHHFGKFDLIEIFIKDEYLRIPSAIPIYIKRLFDNDTLKEISLPKNNYCMVIKNTNERIIYQTDLKTK